MELFKQIDLLDRRKVFVVGDIHGCFTLLEQKLVEVGFDPDHDALISVGDLVDRGPESERAEEFLEYEWFHAIQGNHEQMTLPEYGGTSWHVMNGGSWYNNIKRDFGDEVAHAVGRKLNALPFVLEVSIGDKKFGFVHASLGAITDWNDVPDRLEVEAAADENMFVWDRDHIGRAKRFATFDPTMSTEESQAFNVKNIDRVYFGHTPIKEPWGYGNCRWIDTGAFATGILTVEEVQ